MASCIYIYIAIHINELSAVPRYLLLNIRIPVILTHLSSALFQRCDTLLSIRVVPVSIGIVNGRGFVR